MKLTTSCGILLAVSFIFIIQATPRLNNYDQLTHNDAYEGVDKKSRWFDIFKLGGAYGIAKRLPPQRVVLNGLIPGGGFGRISRNERNLLTNYEKKKKLLSDHNNYFDVADGLEGNVLKSFIDYE